MTTKLHLGCGSIRKNGYVNVDSQARLNPDVIWDLSKFPWPWKDNSVDEIFSNHVFEHLQDAVGTMKECYRILKPGGTVECFVPFAANITYFQDPTHCRPWTDATINYFLKTHPSRIYWTHGLWPLGQELETSCKKFNSQVHQDATKVCPSWYV